MNAPAHFPIFRPGQHVTDSEGNRGQFFRMAPDYVTHLNKGVPQAVVRYVGDKHESVCPVTDLEQGWK